MGKNKKGSTMTSRFGGLDREKVVRSILVCQNSW